MAELIKVLLIEHETLTRIGIETIFGGADDIILAGRTDNAADGFKLFSGSSPDVTILGLRFPDSCSVDDLDKYFSERPKAKIIVLADHAGDAEISRALKKGALGYVCKNIDPEELLWAVRRVATGQKYIPSKIAGILSQHIGTEELTATETNVLRMVVGGMSNKEIAFALDNTENTIKTHVQNIFSKLGVSDRTSATTTAIKRGLVRIDL